MHFSDIAAGWKDTKRQGAYFAFLRPRPEIFNVFAGYFQERKKCLGNKCCISCTTVTTYKQSTAIFCDAGACIDKRNVFYEKQCDSQRLFRPYWFFFLKVRRNVSLLKKPLHYSGAWLKTVTVITWSLRALKMKFGNYDPMSTVVTWRKWPNWTVGHIPRYHFFSALKHFSAF